MASPRVEYPTCGTCERMLERGDQNARCPLPAEDFCGHCARPNSERGNRLSDNAGFLAWARLCTGRRPAAMKGRAMPEAV